VLGLDGERLTRFSSTGNRGSPGGRREILAEGEDTAWCERT
jgi:hypothetical protein